MPSASSKSEKPASTEASDPLRQAIVIIGHKIRNLEKRKSKLDSYKESIKQLTKEQVEAVSKYDEVIQQLELSKEYAKQFTQISEENNRLKKRQARKDALEKYGTEVNKVKQVLLIQDVLQNMVIDSVQQDFLAGKNGAIKISEDDLKLLNNLYIEISPKRISEDGTPNPVDQFQKAADYFMAIIEGKTKEIVGSTGAKLKELVTSIYTSGYFDQQPTGAETNDTGLASKAENETVEEEEEFHENQEISSNIIVPTQNPPEGNLAPVPNSASVQPMIPGPILPGSQPPVLPPNQQQILANVPNIVPTPVSQVESGFYNAQGFKPPAPPSVVPPPNQSARQLNDVIQSVTGKFNFLQESELDLAEMNSGVPGNPPRIEAPPQMPGGPPSAIPTQTFTNQNFNGQPGATPNFPPKYTPQPAAFQAFIPAFPAFVTPNANPVQNNSNALNNSNPPGVGPVNSVNPNIPTSTSNIHSNNKTNISNSIPLAPNRNPNVGFSQGQQQMASGFSNQSDAPNMSQTSSQPVFQPGNVASSSVDTVNNDTVRKETEMKEKQENEKQDWSQTESTNWADDCVETSEWNSQNQNQSDGPSNVNKFSSGRPNRSLGGGVPRNSNGYQGNRPRTHRQGGYRDTQATNTVGGSSHFYQNQNGYQSRSERTNEFSVGGKGNPDLRDGAFKERGDFNNRDRDPRDSYGGGFKRGPPNRGPNMKGPMDRGDRQGQIQRNNPGGPRGPRNVNRQSNGRNGTSFQRQQPNTVGQAPNK